MFVSDNLKDTMNKLEFTTPITANGITCIDHKKRLKLRLSVEEYTIMNAIDAIVLDKKKATVASISSMIGEVNSKLLIGLTSTSKIAIKDNGYICGNEWRLMFPHDDCFNTLWDLFHKAGAKGNKAKGFEAYRKAIKADSMKNIVAGAKAYIAKKISEDNGFIMHLSSFLSPEYQYWRDDYSPQGSNSDHICKTS